MSAPLKEQITNDMKAALKAGEKQRLAAIRLILAAIKQREVDERIELDDAQVLAILDKMIKQRRESISHYEAAKRDDLVAQEAYEIGVIQAYMPEALSSTEVETIILQAITETGATEIKDMGKVMALIKPQLQGRTDMGEVSKIIKAKLS